MFYSVARNNLRSMIDSVWNDCEEYIITTKDKQSAVLRVLDSIEEIEKGQFV
jgi:PHD/YefM family antitoxin component YafN of YafNO toxin-antitoxin module